ncbi:hypothetical protein [Histidinibacterium lentulum]|uniref:Uncharacterized protein n=1 Tax=Histidinibacterium lentulum TaxID=2480588 RepID=A0A3N2R9J1_9RHOB|nr:hypothetical protein [Histidinibacterium lentulum]ROU04140.1 hypothetical protein EAT49_01705 [Histidinibacterium lentulum]
MAVTFHFIPGGLVYVRYLYHVDTAETLRAFAAYARHPERTPGQPQLVDLSAIESFDDDLVSVMKLQAEKASLFREHDENTLVVYYAPTPVSYRMARISQRSWEGLPGVTVAIAEDEIGALELLGRSERSFADLRLPA